MLPCTKDQTPPLEGSLPACGSRPPPTTTGRCMPDCTCTYPSACKRLSVTTSAVWQARRRQKERSGVEGGRRWMWGRGARGVGEGQRCGLGQGVGGRRWRREIPGEWWGTSIGMAGRGVPCMLQAPAGPPMPSIPIPPAPYSLPPPPAARRKRSSVTTSAAASQRQTVQCARATQRSEVASKR